MANQKWQFTIIAPQNRKPKNNKELASAILAVLSIFEVHFSIEDGENENELTIQFIDKAGNTTQITVAAENIERKFDSIELGEVALHSKSDVVTWIARQMNDYFWGPKFTAKGDAIIITDDEVFNVLVEVGGKIQI